jgi:uncharacterized membrane protein YbhN (UPF0104 family)
MTAAVTRDGEHTRGPASGLPLLGRLALPIGLSLAACGLLGWYLLSHQDQWQTVSLASPWLLGVCATASLAALLAPGPIFWVMTSRVGRDVGLAESTWLAVMTSAINSVVPLHAGAAARAVYLKRRHDLDLSAFAATFLGYNILRLLVASLAACATAAGLLLRQGAGIDPLSSVAPTTAGLSQTSPSASGLEGLITIAGGLALVAIGACLARPASFQKLRLGALEQHRLFRPLVKFQAGWYELMRCPRFLLKVLALVMLQIVAELIVVWAAWGAVSVPLSSAAVVLVTSLGILTALTGLTPGGLGLVELVSVAVGLVARGVSLAVLAAATPVALAGLAACRPQPPDRTAESRIRSEGDGLS